MNFASSVCTGVSSLGLCPPLTHIFSQFYVQGGHTVYECGCASW
jgi:hypothetical protein